MIHIQKEIKVKQHLGKNKYKKPKQKKLDEIWASEEITNKMIKTQFAKRIKLAKEKVKNG